MTNGNVKKLQTDWRYLHESTGLMSGPSGARIFMVMAPGRTLLATDTLTDAAVSHSSLRPENAEFTRQTRKFVEHKHNRLLFYALSIRSALGGSARWFPNACAPGRRPFWVWAEDVICRQLFSLLTVDSLVCAASAFVSVSFKSFSAANLQQVFSNLIFLQYLFIN